MDQDQFDFGAVNAETTADIENSGAKLRISGEYHQRLRSMRRNVRMGGEN